MSSPYEAFRVTSQVQIHTGRQAEEGDDCGFATEWAIAPSSGRQRIRPSCRKTELDVARSGVLGHDQVLRLAHETVEAAHDHEPERVESKTRRLFEALSDHMRTERPALMRLRASDLRLIRRGQQQVEGLLLDLATSAAERTEHCECESLAGEVEAELARQATDERRQLLAAAD